jgi:hypothetical protein
VNASFPIEPFSKTAAPGHSCRRRRPGDRPATIAALFGARMSGRGELRPAAVKSLHDNAARHKPGMAGATS